MKVLPSPFYGSRCWLVTWTDLRAFCENLFHVASCPCVPLSVSGPSGDPLSETDPFGDPLSGSAPFCETGKVMGS